MLVSLTRTQALDVVIHISNLAIIHGFKVLPVFTPSVFMLYILKIQSSLDQLVGGLDLENSVFFLLVGIQRVRRLMRNERAALSFPEDTEQAG